MLLISTTLKCKDIYYALLHWPLKSLRLNAKESWTDLQSKQTVSRTNGYKLNMLLLALPSSFQTFSNAQLSGDYSVMKNFTNPSIETSLLSFCGWKIIIFVSNIPFEQGGNWKSEKNAKYHEYKKGIQIIKKFVFY